MKVDKTKPIGDQGHVLEIGSATWNAEDVSVRNRYPNKPGSARNPMWGQPHTPPGTSPWTQAQTLN